MSSIKLWLLYVPFVVAAFCHTPGISNVIHAKDIIILTVCHLWPKMTAYIYINRDNNDWLCTKCTSDMFPFNHYDEVAEFIHTLVECWGNELDIVKSTDKYKKNKLFRPFEHNDADLPHSLDFDPDIIFIITFVYAVVIWLTTYLTPPCHIWMIWTRETHGSSGYDSISATTVKNTATAFITPLTHITYLYRLVYSQRNWKLPGSFLYLYQAMSCYSGITDPPRYRHSFQRYWSG